MAVRVICSGSLQAYGGSAVRYSRRRVSNVFPLLCSSFNRCAVYGGGRLRVSFGATRESECRWLMAKQCCKPPLPFYRPRQAAACKIVCSSSLLYIEGRMQKVEISLQVSYLCENTPKMWSWLAFCTESLVPCQVYTLFRGGDLYKRSTNRMNVK